MRGNNAKEIHELLNEKRIFVWELAAAMGVSECTMYRWFRGEMTAERRAAIMAAIDKLGRKED